MHRWQSAIVPDSLPREDEGHICTQSEKWVELLCLINLGDGVGESPEEDGHHNGSPQLGHDIEEAIGPVTKDGNGTSKPLSSLFKEVDTVLCMQYVRSSYDGIIDSKWDHLYQQYVHSSETETVSETCAQKILDIILDVPRICNRS